MIKHLFDDHFLIQIPWENTMGKYPGSSHWTPHDPPKSEKVLGALLATIVFHRLPGDSPLGLPLKLKILKPFSMQNQAKIRPDFFELFWMGDLQTNGA